MRYTIFMTTEEKANLIKSNSEEILTEEELVWLFNQKMPLNHYIGFEISGKVHLGTGLITMRMIKILQQADIETSCLLANWHSYINRKLGGDMKTITTMARDYFQ